MHAALTPAFFQPDFFPGSSFLTFILTAAVVIPTGYFLASFVDWRAAKISKKHS